MTGAAEAILRRHRGVTLVGLLALAALAWAWIASGAGMGMAMGWDAKRVLLTLAMWWVMMVAMMVPAAARPGAILDFAPCPGSMIRPTRTCT